MRLLPPPEPVSTPIPIPCPNSLLAPCPPPCVVLWYKLTQPWGRVLLCLTSHRLSDPKRVAPQVFQRTKVSAMPKSGGTLLLPGPGFCSAPRPAPFRWEMMMLFKMMLITLKRRSPRAHAQTHRHTDIRNGHPTTPTRTHARLRSRFTAVQPSRAPSPSGDNGWRAVRTCG